METSTEIAKIAPRNTSWNESNVLASLVSRDKAAKTTRPSRLKGTFNKTVRQQEQFIAKKRKEIEDKLQQQAKQRALASQHFLNRPSKAAPPSASETAAQLANKFANDGSFLQQFMKMQQAKTGKQVPAAPGGRAVASPAPGGRAVASPAPGGRAVASPAPGGRAVDSPAPGGRAVDSPNRGGRAVDSPNLIDSCVDSPAPGGTAARPLAPVTTTTSRQLGSGSSSSVRPLNPAAVRKRPSPFATEKGSMAGTLPSQGEPSSHTVPDHRGTFRLPSEDEEKDEDYEQWLEIDVLPPEDPEIRKVIEEMAGFVADGGLELEKMAIEEYKNHAEFAFIRNRNGSEFLFYRKRVAEIRKGKQKVEEAPPPKVSIVEDNVALIVAEKLAKLISEEGPNAEAVAMESNRNNPSLSFLYDPTSKIYKHYKEKLEEYRKGRHDLAVALATLASNRQNGITPSDTTPVPSSSTSMKQTAVKKKRKSRWGPEEEKIDLPIAEIPSDQPDTSALTVQALEGLGYAKGKPHGLVGVTELSEAQKKQVKEQQEMQQMYDMIMKHKRAMQEMQMMWEKVIAEQQFEYDSDEEVDNDLGTWEHQLRCMEMEKTREWAEQLTEMGRGKHFIGDFLPPDELDKFMETFKALKEGKEPDYSEYKEFKLTVENIGYQMLMKMGWKEGDGLGSDGQGIVNPVNKGVIARDGAGFGIDRPAVLSKHDDEYDAFRKRMMLAYRFRPNPLNNPRRPYY
ncbi:SURP and G-patch domain-containing protein 1 isoform X2 [Ambystoma mexicanum]|uniref:SURP and G-patch domain-containing protein 1 isoform X2 n=1 Tax=Ambystoma mexicanum TaxID=8296 RepID=UPI0037E91224